MKKFAVKFALMYVIIEGNPIVLTNSNDWF